jgi:transposase
MSVKAEWVNRLANATVLKRIASTLSCPASSLANANTASKGSKKQIAQLDAAIASLIASDEGLKTQSQLLCSIPAIAEVTAAKILSELAGKEFQSARQLGAYAGLTPAEFPSGYSLYGKTHLSQIGNAFLPKALYLPAAVARRWCKPLQPSIAILQSRKLSNRAIRGAIMRKLLHIAFRCS